VISTMHPKTAISSGVHTACSKAWPVRRSISIFAGDVIDKAGGADSDFAMTSLTVQF